MDLFDEIRITRRTPVNLLHGTDWWTDCDDAAALRLLLRAHKAGIIRLLGIGINSVMEASAPSVSAFCTAEGVEIPIGVDTAARRPGENCRYQRLLAAYPHSVKRNEDCPEAWKLYRKALAGCEGKADILDVGFPQIIMELLQSGPDEFSPLTGIELVKEKVNRVWLMAGKWDEEDGKEYNLSAYPLCSEAGDFLCRSCPVPIIFLGYEIGEDVITLPKEDEADLLWLAFKAHGSAKGRASWDPMTALLAITQSPETSGYTLVRGRAKVDPATGENSFTEDPAGSHSYVKRNFPPEYYAAVINSLI